MKTRISPDDVPWTELESLGITKGLLEKTNNLEPLLNFERTSLLPIRGKLQKFEITGGDAKFFFRTVNGKLRLRIELVRLHPNLKIPIYGTYLTPEQETNCLKTGSAGEPIIINTKNGKIPLLVTLDKETNHLIPMEQDKVKIKDRIANVKITPEVAQLLKSGAAVMLSGLKKKDGSTFDSLVQYSTVAKDIVFVRVEEKHKREKKRKI